MLTLRHDQLQFRFDDLHPSAQVTIALQRTLRIPDDGRSYPLPPGLGPFPMRHVDDYAERVPEDWRRRGGVMVPMWQAEALWIQLMGSYVADRGTAYPCAVKIAAGKRSAVTGQAWQPGLTRGPQDYVVVPTQPWLDGFCVEKGVIRQFVAMPLGQGYSVEEQLSGAAEFGGLQLEVFPMKREVFERRFPIRPVEPWSGPMAKGPVMPSAAVPGAARSTAMGLGAGGRMRQEISVDPYDLEDWDTDRGVRCFVHLCNSEAWQGATGSLPPTPPPTAKQYNASGLPWFEYYADGPAVEGGGLLSKIKSVLHIGQQQGQNPLPENASLTPKVTLGIGSGRKDDQVRTGEF